MDFGIKAAGWVLVGAMGFLSEYVKLRLRKGIVERGKVYVVERRNAMIGYGAGAILLGYSLTSGETWAWNYSLCMFSFSAGWHLGAHRW